MNKVISGKTSVCVVIGEPIEHTASPAIHNAAFDKMGLDYLFVAFRVKNEDLGKAIDGMRAFGIRGLSVTVPHKVSVIPFMDNLDSLAQKIEAVNTVVNENGLLTGYNTDADGFLKALCAKGIEPQGMRFAVLGAGGAARAICFALAESGAKRIIILNRLSGLKRAESLALRVSEFSSAEIRALELTDKNTADVLKNVDAVVNATTLGMSPEIGQTPIRTEILRAGLVVIDIIYNPLTTRLLQEAEQKGARIINGLEMLVCQGASAFELWTGVQAPVDVMREAAAKELHANEK